MSLNKKDICTIPNLLSLIRLALIPVFIVMYLSADGSQDAIAAAIVILISSLTDFLDGWIARHFHQVSELGKFLDPLADKLTHGAVAICMAFRIPGMILIVILLAVKELFMGVAGLVFLRKRGRKLNGAKWFGKLSTIVLDTVLFILLFLYPEWIPLQLCYFLLGISAAFLSLSFILYIYEFIKMYRLPHEPSSKA